MIITIPLGGLGTRFKKFGYNLPKPLINVLGKPILYWLLDNLNFNKIDLLCIPYNQELINFRFEDKLKKDYPNINFLFLPLYKNTEGAAETLFILLKKLEELNIKDKPILSLDGDNFYLEDIITKWNGSNSVFCFEDNSNEEIYSYIKFDNNKISDIKEKSKISNYANTGAYGFNSWKNLKLNIKYILDNKIKQKNEYYISNVIKQMIKTNDFEPKIINIDNYVCLGTPIHVRLFCNNYPRISAINNNMMLKPKRYCFDLDNTLVSFPKIKNDYTSVEPIKENIKFLKYLKKMGNYIIIYTARRMKTHNSNKGKLMKDIGKITFDTLEKFDIPYDEIYFGKPYADFYIDDLAINCFNELEKELGFYKSNISPRDFNQINSSSIQIYKKISYNLEPEIYYYNNIPNSCKDIFPLFINYDSINFKFYEMEKINGIPISKLYLSQELDKNLLLHILGTINRLHNVNHISNDINIYKNYFDKLVHRYKNYDYSKFKNSLNIYNKLLNISKLYEKNNNGIKGVIHGDPVFTNILVNQFGKIKLIDMRGKVGDELTIYGDILYDYAKIYQSLIGYDEILENKRIDITYKNELINVFKEFIINKFDNNTFINIKNITDLLLFTLIPLHNNDKCFDYYNLISLVE